MRGPHPVRGARRRLALTLRRLRAERSWTQEDVAANAGINPRTVRDLEAGRLNVTLDTLERLARAYRVDVTELLRHET